MARELPALIREIADIVGLPAALKLAEAKGGQQIFIPNVVPADHWLVDLIGKTAANALSAYFTHETGEHLQIPKAEILRHRSRLTMVKTLLAEGRSANDIAAMADLSRRDVFRKKKQLRERQEHPQLDMFPPDKSHSG